MLRAAWNETIQNEAMNFRLYSFLLSVPADESESRLVKIPSACGLHSVVPNLLQNLAGAAA